MRLVVNKEYGGFTLSSESLEYLRTCGFSEDEVSKIRDGKCPRDLPELIYCVENIEFKHRRYDKRAKFDTTLRIVELSDSNYYIEEYDGYEEVITPKHLGKPRETLKQYTTRMAKVEAEMFINEEAPDFDELHQKTAAFLKQGEKEPVK